MCPLKTGDLQRIFIELDKNGDGFVSLEELNWLLERIRVQQSLNDLESLVGKRSLDFTEFLLFWDSISKPEYDMEEADLANAFNVFDLNGDGFISSEELQYVLSRLGLWNENTGKDCKSMICMYDTNFDGLLDFQEFKYMMSHTTQS
ncbi:hypothetical protein ACOSP7_009754 [Xanthoceras sorbifolium]|uniref:EF-hand domain-containing protein n=1 Tax=Xanthoceras sorbifolium TaxID=99658 RepID=A0ABQ8HUL0_9ROSI|nr:hypothetical protein JRO89_XS07G0197200 [Xanthoceras sorbifolium]